MSDCMGNEQHYQNLRDLMIAGAEQWNTANKYDPVERESVRARTDRDAKTIINGSTTLSERQRQGLREAYESSKVA